MSTPRLAVKPHPDDEEEVRRAFEEDDGCDLVVTPEQLDAWANHGVLPWAVESEEP